MSRPALTPRLRDELLKLLLETVKRDRDGLAAKISHGAHRNIALATSSENALLLLVGAVFGDSAEVELSRLLEWNPAGRIPRGETYWLNTACLRANLAAIEAKTTKVQP